jgi:hypothetical protein
VSALFRNDNDGSLKRYSGDESIALRRDDDHSIREGGHLAEIAASTVIGSNKVTPPASCRDTYGRAVLRRVCTSYLTYCLAF